MPAGPRAARLIRVIILATSALWIRASAQLHRTVYVYYKYSIVSQCNDYAQDLYPSIRLECELLQCLCCSLCKWLV